MTFMDRLRSFFGFTLEGGSEWYQSGWARPTSAGISVTANNAIRVAAVMACVKVISESVGQLPVNLYRRMPEGGKEKAVDHPLYGVLHDLPNSFMTSGELFESACVNIGLGGMAYHWVERDGRGAVRFDGVPAPHSFAGRLLPAFCSCAQTPGAPGCVPRISVRRR